MPPLLTASHASDKYIYTAHMHIDYFPNHIHIFKFRLYIYAYVYIDKYICLYLIYSRMHMATMYGMYYHYIKASW